jgi:hypothetical protein
VEKHCNNPQCFVRKIIMLSTHTLTFLLTGLVCGVHAVSDGFFIPSEESDGLLVPS